MSNENALLYRCAYLWLIKSYAKLYYLYLLFRTNAEFLTKISIPEIHFTHDVTTASNCINHIFGVYKMTKKSRSNVFSVYQ